MLISQNKLRLTAEAIKGISGVQEVYSSDDHIGIDTDSVQDQVFIEGLIEDRIDGRAVRAYAAGDDSSMYTTGTVRDYQIVFSDMPGVLSVKADEADGPSFQIKAAGSEKAEFLDKLLKDKVDVETVEWEVQIQAVEPITSDFSNYIEAVKRTTGK